ncbi:hypothetical protein V8G54_028185 [Vigna mungo]|uniref:Uncharacterized protein n=1 Tax=Vigna mungo TaxID=3915 RepID=A0AAQ3MSI4_VIGMU
MLESSKIAKFFRFSHSNALMSPPNGLLDITNSSNDCISCKDKVNPPLNLLFLRSIRVRFLRLANSFRRVPSRSLWLTSSFNAEVKLPSVEGKDPDNELLLKSKINNSFIPSKTSGILPLR